MTEYEHMEIGTPIPHLHCSSVKLHIGDTVQGIMCVKDYTVLPCGGVLISWHREKVVGTLRYMVDTSELCVVTGGFGSRCFDMRFLHPPKVVKRWNQDDDDFGDNGEDRPKVPNSPIEEEITVG